MKYILVLLTVCLMCSCQFREDLEDRVLYKQTQTEVVETIIYKTHIVQRHTVVVDTPIKSVAVSPEDMTGGQPPEEAPKKKQGPGSTADDKTLQQ